MTKVTDLEGWRREREGSPLYYCADCGTPDFYLGVDGYVFCSSCRHHIPGLSVSEVDDEQSD